MDRSVAVSLLGLVALGCGNDTAIVQVDATLDTLLVSPASVTLAVTDTATLTASGLSALGLPVEVDVTWSSLDEQIASVSDGGLLTGVGEGSTTIAATAEGITTTAAVTVSGPPEPPVEIEVDGTNRRFGPLPVVTYALVDDATGTDLYPVGASEQVRLFGIFDTGTSPLRLYNLDPYEFQVPGDPDQGLVLAMPNRVTDGNYFSSDAALLGMSVEETVRVRINGLGAIDATTLDAPFGAGAAQIEVPGIPARPQPSSQPLNLSLIGGELTWSVAAAIDYTTLVTRGPYDFYPGLTDRSEAATGIAGFAAVENVAGPDITFYDPSDPAIPTLPLQLRLRRVGARYELVGLQFRHGPNTYHDADLSSLPQNLFDTGTTITYFGDVVAGALGLTAGSGGFDCLGGTANGYVIDAVSVTGANGVYTVTDASVCWSQASLASSQYAVTGSNLFDQVPTVFNGATDSYWVGEPTASPILWPHPGSGGK